jgi:outer membrane protein assembly factor BamB
MIPGNALPACLPRAPLRSIGRIGLTQACQGLAGGFPFRKETLPRQTIGRNNDENYLNKFFGVPMNRQDGRIFLTVCLLGITGSQLYGDDWTRFRGDDGKGIVSSPDFPTSWGANENLKWSVDLPGPGSSSPVVSGDRVFVTCYTGYGVDRTNPGNAVDLQRHLICLDRLTGKELWRVTVQAENEEDAYQGFIAEHGYASSTPATDGQHIFAFFGKDGVVACDMDGKLIWKQGVGTYSDPARWGGGASPVLYGDLVIVNAGIEGHALLALRKSDGAVAWKVEDDGFTNCWSTPSLVAVDGRTELVYSVPDWIYGYDPETGKELWRAASPISNTITASTTVDESTVYTLGGRQGKAIALHCGGEGDASATNTVWTSGVNSTIGTPVVFGKHMFWLASGAIATCVDKETGGAVNQVRLSDVAQTAGGSRRGPAGNYASPIVINDLLVFVTRNGTTHVVRADESLEKVATNRFEGDDSLFNATPAFSRGNMYIRSDKKLYCIGH